MGRDVIQTQAIHLPLLDPDTIARLRAPLDPEDLARLKREVAVDSDDEEQTEVPGAFPDSQGQSSSYF